MRIVIVGAGIVGSNLAAALSAENHEISVVDADGAKGRRLSDKLDVHVVTGEGTRPSVLRRAGIEKADMVIAVTNVDEVNVLVCVLADKMGVKRKIARVRNEEYGDPASGVKLSDLHVDNIINPEEIVVRSVDQILGTPGATNVADFADGEILMRGFHVPVDAPIAGRSLAELREVSDTEAFLIAGISSQGVLRIPRGKDVIHADDTIFVLIMKDMLPLFLPFINRRVNEVQRVVIYGATTAGRRLAQVLEQKLERVFLIDPSRDRTDFAAGVLHKTTVLCGEATELEVLQEASIDKADAFVALTEDDQANLLAALLARRHGAARVIVQATQAEYVPVLNSIGIDSTLNPRLVTVGAILEHIRRGRIRSVVKLADSEAEAIELTISPSSVVAGKKIHEISFPEDAVIGAIAHEGRMVIPNGNSVLQPGDSIVVVSLPRAIPRIERLFGDKSGAR